MFFRNDEEARKGIDRLLAAAPSQAAREVLPTSSIVIELGKCTGSHRDWRGLAVQQYSYTPRLHRKYYSRRGFMCPNPDVYAAAVERFLGSCTLDDPPFLRPSTAVEEIVTHETAHWEAAQRVPQLDAMLGATVFSDDSLIAPYVLPYGLRAVRAIERASISAAPLLPSPSDLLNLEREFGCTDRTHLVSAIETYRAQSGIDLRLPDDTKTTSDERGGFAT